VIVIDQPDQEPASDLRAVDIDAGKRRASLSDEAEESPSKKTRRADYSHFDSISVVASNGNVIFLPQIPPEIFPAAPVSFILLPLNSKYFKAIMWQVTIGGLLGVKMIQLSGEVALKRSAKEKSVNSSEVNVPRQR
jgi:hypothetical protein